jgi:hypothetical protein
MIKIYCGATAMYLRKYSNINKYFAFVFVVFAVLSGVSENQNEVSSASAKGSGLPYFLRINQLLAQGIIKMRVHPLFNKQHPFLSYLQTILPEREDVDFYKAGLLFGSLYFSVCYLNGILVQNNIWRNAVF